MVRLLMIPTFRRARPIDTGSGPFPPDARHGARGRKALIALWSRWQARTPRPASVKAASACTRLGATASRPRPRAAQVATLARARCRATTARRGPAEATRPEPRTCHQPRWCQLTLHYSWIDAHDTTRQAQARRFTRFGCRFQLADLVDFRG